MLDNSNVKIFRNMKCHYNDGLRMKHLLEDADLILNLSDGYDWYRRDSLCSVHSRTPEQVKTYRKAYEKGMLDLSPSFLDLSEIKEGNKYLIGWEGLF